MRSEMEPDQRIQQAIRELRSEGVADSTRQRVRSTLKSPSQRLRFRPGYAVATIGVASLALLLIPRQRALAWSQVVSEASKQTRYHVLIVDTPSKPSQRPYKLEFYVDGAKYASVFNDATRFETRNDGHVLFMKLPNRPAVKMKILGGHMIQHSAEDYMFPNILRRHEMVEQGTSVSVTRSGKQLVRYSAKAEHDPEHKTFWIYVEPDTSRIVSIELLGPDGKVIEVQTIEYPDTIPASVFEPPVTKEKIYDLDEDAAKVAAAMKHGVPFGRGNVLRAALVSPDNQLLVLLTGAAPPGDGSVHPYVLGNAVGSVDGPSEWTASRVKARPSARYDLKFGAEPLCGQNLVMKSAVSDRITLKMPVFVEDHTRPIKSKDGKVLGFESKEVGETVVRDYPVIRTLPFEILGPLKRLLRANPKR